MWDTCQNLITSHLLQLLLVSFLHPYQNQNHPNSGEGGHQWASVPQTLTPAQALVSMDGDACKGLVLVGLPIYSVVGFFKA
jgi:hypothetical protein